MFQANLKIRGEKVIVLTVPLTPPPLSLVLLHLLPLSPILSSRRSGTMWPPRLAGQNPLLRCRFSLWKTLGQGQRRRVGRDPGVPGACSRMPWHGQTSSSQALSQMWGSPGGWQGQWRSPASRQDTARIPQESWGQPPAWGHTSPWPLVPQHPGGWRSSRSSCGACCPGGGG
ncbi:unnamed protein product, partial [Discosporangium mesarthrocarpum]